MSQASRKLIRYLFAPENGTFELTNSESSAYRLSVLGLPGPHPFETVAIGTTALGNGAAVGFAGYAAVRRELAQAPGTIATNAVATSAAPVRETDRHAVTFAPP